MFNLYKSLILISSLFAFPFFKSIAQCNQANFGVTDIGPIRCKGQAISFTNPNNLSGGIYYFRFYTNSNSPIGNSSYPVTGNGIISPSIFTSPGSYKAVLVFSGTTSTPCTDSIVVSFQVEDFPAAPAFSHNGPKCGQTNTTLNVTSPTASLTYSWDFGDPGSGASNLDSGTLANHIFSILPNGLGGNYSVVLKATTPFGCATSSAPLVVPVKATPRIVLSDPDFNTQFAWKRCQLDGNSVDSIRSFQFDNQSKASSGTSYSYSWGDGTTNTNFTQTDLPDTLFHTYSSFGVKTGILTGTDPNGCVSTFSFKVVNEKFPSASLSIPSTQISICEGTSVSVSNNSRNATSYTWIWGDGDSLLTNSENTQSHQYGLKDSIACQITSATGIQRPISLIASNTCYNHKNTSPIYVRPLPRIKLEFDSIACVEPVSGMAVVPFSISVCPNRNMNGNPTFTTIYFNNINSGQGDSIVFSPNQPMSGINHSFSQGNYEIKVIAKNSCGYNVKSKTLEICNTSGQQKHSSPNPVRLYPNPVAGEEIYLTAEGGQNFRIIDFTGRVFFPKVEFRENHFVLFTGFLPRGTFVLEWESAEKVFRIPLIK
jgi:hypothetical protein